MSSEYKTIQTPHGLASYSLNTCDNCGRKWTDEDPAKISRISVYTIFRDDFLWKQHKAEGMLRGEACSVKCFRVLMVSAMEKYFEILAADRKEVL